MICIPGGSKKMACVWEATKSVFSHQLLIPSTKVSFLCILSQGTRLGAFSNDILLVCFWALFKTRIEWFNDFCLYLNVYKTVRFHQINISSHTLNILSYLSMCFVFYCKEISLIWTLIYWKMWENTGITQWHLGEKVRLLFKLPTYNTLDCFSWAWSSLRFTRANNHQSEIFGGLNRCLHYRSTQEASFLIWYPLQGIRLEKRRSN